MLNALGTILTHVRLTAVSYCKNIILFSLLISVDFGMEAVEKGLKTHVNSQSRDLHTNKLIGMPVKKLKRAPQKVLEYRIMISCTK